MPIHALIVDDNLQNLKVLAKMLTKQGVNTTGISESSQVMKLLPTLPAMNVVFLDLEMPDLDGYHLKNLLRPKFGDVPIIAYTVHTSQINTVREQGFNGMLGKPLDNLRFPDQFARILRGEGVWERI